MMSIMIQRMTTAFDSVATVRRMEDAGLSREAPEAVAATAREAADASREALATKADLYQALYKFAVGIVIANAGVAVAIAFALSKAMTPGGS